MSFKQKKLALLLLAPLLVSLTAMTLVTQEAETDASTAGLTYLEPEIKHARTAEEILSKLQRRHYEKRPFNDHISSLLLDTYLDNLDPNKSYFTAADVAKFEQYRFALDDGMRRGNLKPSFIMFNRYRDIAIDHLERIIGDLPNDVAALNFSRDETIELDSETLKWATNDEERDERVRKSLKNSVLSLRLSDKDDEAILEALEKRYKNQLNRLKQLNAEDVFQVYMNSLVGLYDPHSNYMSPRTSENFSINMSLSLEGIGAVLSSDGEYTVVERLVKGGPAELQGDLKPKDRITGVAQGNEGEVEDVVGWRLDEVVQLIRGKKNTTVKLEVQNKDSANQFESKYIKIVRNKVKLEEQAAQKEVLDIHHDGALKKIGVVQVPTFYHDYEAAMRGEKNVRSTTRDVRLLLSELDEEGVDGVVIDLRGNGGGYLEEARTLTGLFVERGPVVQIRMSNGKIKSEANYPNPEHYDKPIVVLIDRLSASASEIFAGAIQDYRRGLIIGSQSFGKGTVQQVTSLNHGALKLTEAKYYRVSGDSTQHRGVIPDIALPSLYDASEIGEDTLDHALNWDQVPPLRHRRYGDFAPITEQIKQKHEVRIKDDPDYRYLIEQIKLNDKYNAMSALPLNLEVRQAMIEQDESERESIENERRIAKGLPPLDKENKDSDKTAANGESQSDGSTSPIATQENASTVTNQEDADEEDNDARTDFLLTEAAHILLDAITLSNQPSLPLQDRVAANALAKPPAKNIPAPTATH
ncbi:carboxy terminal-processing peptidase [bacterium]|nr:carboxy terminal-processing peptidase [bacterium]